LALVAVPSSAQPFVLNEPFSLGVGDTRKLEESQFSITFVGVEHDGRCPIGVLCVWEGDARARFDVCANGLSQVVTLHTAGREDLPSSIEALGRTISLVNLEPYPHVGVKIRADSYAATLSIS
jgi:hypothetical protein